MALKGAVSRLFAWRPIRTLPQLENRIGLSTQTNSRMRTSWIIHRYQVSTVPRECAAILIIHVYFNTGTSLPGGSNYHRHLSSLAVAGPSFAIANTSNWRAQPHNPPMLVASSSGSCYELRCRPTLNP